MIVVSNTSPITNLASIGQLDLLRELYGEVSIPQAVFDEIVVAGEGRPGAEAVRDSAWVVVRPAGLRDVRSALELELDAGEAEAIALAVELGADLVLLDERLGRRAARRLGLRPFGLLGVLLESKNSGLVTVIRPLLDDLRTVAGFWLSDDLYNEVLRLAGE